MRRFPKLLAVVVLLLLRCVASAASATLDVGDARIVFVPPQGHCELDAREPLDARFIARMAEALGPELRILAAFADCTQLSVWRKGLTSRIRDYGFVTTLREDEGRSLAAPRAEVVKALAGEFARLDAASVQADAARPAEAAGSAAGIRPLGVLHADAQAVYYGLVGRVPTDEGRSLDSLEVGAMTLIKGKVVSYLLYGEFRGRTSVDAMLAVQRRNMGALIAAN